MFSHPEMTTHPQCYFKNIKNKDFDRDGPRLYGTERFEKHAGFWSCGAETTYSDSGQVNSVHCRSHKLCWANLLKCRSGKAFIKKNISSVCSAFAQAHIHLFSHRYNFRFRVSIILAGATRRWRGAWTPIPPKDATCTKLPWSRDLICHLYLVMTRRDSHNKTLSVLFKLDPALETTALYGQEGKSNQALICPKRGFKFSRCSWEKRGRRDRICNEDVVKQFQWQL